MSGDHKAYLAGAHFEQNVDVRLVLEKSFKVNNVGVVERLVDLDLVQQLAGQKKTRDGRE